MANKYNRPCLWIDGKILLAFDSVDQRRILREYDRWKNKKGQEVMCINCGVSMRPIDMGIMGSMHQVCGKCVKKSLPGHVVDEIGPGSLPGGKCTEPRIVCLMDWTGKIYTMLRRRD